MSRSSRIVVLGLALVFAPALILPLSSVTAGLPPGPEFDRTWARTDLPVAEGIASRTWFWGPRANTGIIIEPNFQAQGGAQFVQYYDKSRMEIPDPGGDQSSPWYVRNGLLINEMITGKVQVGDDEFREFAPSTALVAGDLSDPDGLSYETVGTLANLAPFGQNSILTTRLLPDGSQVEAPDFVSHSVTAEYYVRETDHRVASVFWEFLNSSGIVWDGERYVDEALFANSFFGSGFPITEAYWLTVRVSGVPQDVLFQCFERRCLTFTPGNPDGWKVESNNVGLHYYEWRYNEIDFDGRTEPPDEDPVLPTGQYVADDGTSHTMWLEVAANDSTRACGLMHRDSLATDNGMLFVWNQDIQGSFWNCNTFVPLTLAWIDSDGYIIGFSDMQAQIRGQSQNVVSYAPPGPFRYVIEANQGWFESRGIEVGDRVILDNALSHGDTGSDMLCQQHGLNCY